MDYHSLPWTRKHMPKSLKDIEGQALGIRELKEYLLSYKNKKKKAVLIYGPSGCGKTSAAHAAANELNLEIIEINASDVRNQTAIEKILGSALHQQSLFSKGKIILVDELDSIGGNKDRGGLTTLAKLVDKSSFPIVMTANDPFNRKFSGIRKKSEMIEFLPLNYKIITEYLAEILKKENIKYDDDAIITLARRAAGDLRGALTDLQILASLGDKISLNLIDSLGFRLKDQKIEQALLKVFKNSDIDISRMAFDDVNENLDEALLWLEENLPKEYTKPADLQRGFYYLSLADVYKGRIRRWQYWRLLAYVNLFATAGISTAKDEKYLTPPSYKPTSRLLKMFFAKLRFQKRNNIAEKIADNTFDSKKDIIKDSLPYFMPAFKKNKSFADEFGGKFELNNDEIAWLTK